MGNKTLSKDIILDEEAFNKAIEEFDALSIKLRKLRNDIEDMLNTLKTGFDTPAGVKFINACEQNLFRPMDAQEIVLEHISKTLSESKAEYDSVFRDYEALQSIINSHK